MQYSLKRIFFTWFVIYLSITALIAIGIFISGQMGEIATKTLLTTFNIGAYSIIALSYMILWNRQPKHFLAILGLIFSFLCLLIAISIIWKFEASTNTIKLFLLLLVLTISTSHASLLLATCHTNQKNINILLYTTLFFITLVAAQLIYLIFEIESISSDVFFRCLGVTLVLDALGTIITPISKKFLIKTRNR